MSETKSWWSENSCPKEAQSQTLQDINAKLQQLGFDKEDGSSKAYIDAFTGNVKLISLYDSELNLHRCGIHVYGIPRLVKAQCAILRPGAIPPIRKRPTDAGYDILSNIDVVLPSRGNVDISTGIAIAVQRGFYFTVEGRSGLGTKHRVVPFSGTIDACYVGELFVMLTNNLDAPFEIKVGDRIAQLIVKEQLDLDNEVVEVFTDEYKARGTAGFGSSGR